MKDFNAGTFRYWCHKVLPLVYDDSLSYYELLCKLNEHINKLIGTDIEIFGLIDNIEAEMKILQEEIDNLQEFSIDYFYERSWLNNKKVVVYGDSTIYKPYQNISYMDIVEKICHCTVTNRAIGGTTMNYGTNNGVALIGMADDLNDFDVIFLAYGTNEWQTGRRSNDIRNDIVALIQTVLSKNRNLEIVFINPFWSKMNETDHPHNFNSSGMTLERVNEIIQNELAVRNIKYIDLYHLSACNEYNYLSYLEESGSTGIYVHPNDELKKNIASVIFKGGDSKTKLYAKERMLRSYDFVEEQSNVTLAEYGGSGRFGSNLCIKIDANTTAESTQKVIDNNETSEYLIVGNTSQNITISFGGQSVDVITGRFKIRLIGLSSAFGKLAITTTEQTIISDLQLYHITAYGTGETQMYQFGRSHKLTAASGIVFGVREPSFFFNEVGININSGGFTITQDVSANAVLMTLPNDVYIIQSFVTIYNTTTGDMYPLMISGHNVSTLGAIPNGSYILMDKLICVPYNVGFFM